MRRASEAAIVGGCVAAVVVFGVLLVLGWWT